MAVNSNFYLNSSRYYKNVNIVNVILSYQEKSFPLVTDQIAFTDSEIQFFYNVDQSEEARLDLISYKLYGNTRFWWAIASANQIEDLLERPKAGDVLKIPSIAAIGKYV